MIIIIEPDIRKAVFTAFGKTGSKTHEWKYDAKTRPADVLRRLAGGEALEAVSFLLRFGGGHFDRPARIGADFTAELAKEAESFPVYIPHACALITRVTRECAGVPLFAFFESSFFSALPEDEKRYPIDQSYSATRGIAKRGYHGMYHGAHARMFGANDRIVSVVLDRYTTVCALQGGKPRAVSLGCTPLEGIMSARTCGDIDPGVIVYLMKEHGFSLYRVDDMLKNKSGFYGMTGYNLPPDELIKLYGKDDKATLAFDVYANQVLKYLGDCIAVLHGLDTVVFAGRYVAPLAQIVYRLAKEMSFLGITLAELPGETGTELRRITSENSERHVYIHTRGEADLLCRETRELLGNTNPAPAA